MSQTTITWRAPARSRRRAGWLGSALLTLFTALVCIFLVAPILVVVLSSLTAADYVTFPPQGFSLRWYAEVFHNGEFVSSFLISLRIAVCAAAIASVTGVLAAVGIVRLRFRGRELLSALFLSPLVLPGLVLGVAILQLYSRTGVASSFVSLILGHAAIGVPYTIRLMVGSLIGFDRRLELAAQNLGASPFQAFRRITMPILLPAIAGGAAFAFIVSLDDINLALFLSGPQSTTLPVRIFTYMSQESSPIISAAGSLLVVLVAATGLVVDRLTGLANVIGR